MRGREIVREREREAVNGAEQMDVRTMLFIVYAQWSVLASRYQI